MSTHTSAAKPATKNCEHCGTSLVCAVESNLCANCEASVIRFKILSDAANHLRKTERGRAALRNLSNFMCEGGLGLDIGNKKACAELFMAALNNPWDLPAILTTKGGDL